MNTILSMGSKSKFNSTRHFKKGRIGELLILEIVLLSTLEMKKICAAEYRLFWGSMKSCIMVSILYRLGWTMYITSKLGLRSRCFSIFSTPIYIELVGSNDDRLNVTCDIFFEYVVGLKDLID